MSKILTDGLCVAEVELTPGQLLGLVCVKGGADCPLLTPEEAAEVLERLATDPTVAIRLVSDADEMPHYSTGEGRNDPADAMTRLRDLLVLQRLGLAPGDTRRARYLYELLFDRIETPAGICAHQSPGWEGCPVATSGAYEGVRDRSWREIVHSRTEEERAAWREASERAVAEGERLHVRPHHLMCMSCWYNGGAGVGPRPNDTLAEILARIQQEPDVPITLVEGQCEACNCCDGFHPQTGRCVHGGGLIRDYLKDLLVLQRIGLMPGDTMPARELLALIFERITSTTQICGWGDGVATADEWRVCGGPDGNTGYARTRQTGVFPESG